MSVAIRICLLACLYNLKANRNQFNKYFEVYMILKDDCTEQLQNGHSLQSKCEMRKWKHVLCDFSIPPPPCPWATIFYGSRDQRPPGSLLHKRKEPGNEVVTYIVQFQNGGCVMSGQIIFLAISLNFGRIVLCFSCCVVLWT